VSAILPGIEEYYDGNTSSKPGQVAGPAGQVSQVVDLMVGRQVGRVDRGVGQEVDKMAEDEVGSEIDQEVGASNSFD
jgi:hypothetical protein